MAKSSVKKHDYTFYFDTRTSDLIDTHLGPSGAKCRSAFVEEAIQLYCNKLDSKESRMFLDDEIIRVIRAIVKETEAKLSSHLRSMDISLSVLSVLFAANLVEMSDDDIALMRRDAIRYVDENRRARSVVTALKEQRGDD